MRVRVYICVCSVQGKCNTKHKESVCHPHTESCSFFQQNIPFVSREGELTQKRPAAINPEFFLSQETACSYFKRPAHGVCAFFQFKAMQCATSHEKKTLVDNRGCGGQSANLNLSLINLKQELIFLGHDILKSRPSN